ncbi:pyrroloquinoline quinone biosynthesis protein PqqE [Prauserella marina]|uniref:PqqA peptide cyclase n=1 Tax=Prauserella marina TaxID=530584 RepID=A0A222VWV3_9PSEU|nr:pyrroloquinoline quinone biosynthesis protein PqqE [Prauserella marina]ASR38408.1 pyrroloquinoline quinone biosynthesis protein PqqE [Prauserella marina]PWV78359.1 pyrroloquinoline quinone biosynthesis protein E [Prauserella marina]SDC84255.1 pyrroloquinoline quinone biosynthesis protein E [Prauserella marina]
MGVTAAPLGMLAELTHRCPLHCPYCSNPLELVTRESELSTEEWLSVLAQARELGVLQVHFSGGEPLARSDLATLVAKAAELGCYASIVTSGLGLTERRLAELVDNGLAHVQLSVQAAEPVLANEIAGTKAHQHKLTAAELVHGFELPLSVNAVLHRANHHQLAGIIELAERMRADRLELANTQYYGWALRNRDALMPTREQLAEAEPIVRAAVERLRDRMQIVYVLSDYYEPYPKPCMSGWGAQQLTVAPDGTVLPCPAATAITTLTLENVRDRPLADIWYFSESFNAYRGEDWMKGPCRTCERRSKDFGGCRCQAFLLTGDAAATDPVCTRSPDRGLVDVILEAGQGETPPFVMRGKR